MELVREDEKEDDELQTLCDKMRDRFNDKGVIETIKEICPNYFVYCKGLWCGWTGEKWLANDVPLKKAIMYDLPKYWNGLLSRLRRSTQNPKAKSATRLRSFYMDIHHDLGMLMGLLANWRNS